MFYINVQEYLLKFPFISEYDMCLIMLYILYIAMTLVGDWLLFQIKANTLFDLLYRLENKHCGRGIWHLIWRAPQTSFREVVNSRMTRPLSQICNNIVSEIRWWTRITDVETPSYFYHKL